MRILSAIVIAAVMGGSALAQTTPSTSDAPAASGQNPQADPKHSSPGATGAMENKSSGVATSPQEVQEQSKGAGEAGKGTTSPGTVGAAPGSDSEQPKQK
ncbi:hypothetical protein [Hansschlegelia plantiphila]|uniref:Proteophosphoglycan ppg4 n=1 Tax=Hansschlegelia plantiphila TaxID=374655 RepID=A0A9W6J2H6_9HYPH|nr:hypothetical protein [Hansschlegelia plantiphila]GLK69645.1 hypothetical protein GCM10008179_32830 [Hansschlegelia plantiphila]